MPQISVSPQATHSGEVTGRLTLKGQNPPKLLLVIPIRELITGNRAFSVRDPFGGRVSKGIGANRGSTASVRPRPGTTAHSCATAWPGDAAAHRCGRLLLASSLGRPQGHTQGNWSLEPATGNRSLTLEGR